jgi:NTP pyrophosphatase (non-canonical NTP hydrolase)
MGGWVRNNLKDDSVSEEVGDVLMMLLAFCIQEGVDPVEEMMKKFSSKGFKLPGNVKVVL